MPLQVFFAILLMALGISQSQMVGAGALSAQCAWCASLLGRRTAYSDPSHIVPLRPQAFPDVSKAKSSIQNVFTLIDSRPKNIDIDAPGETCAPRRALSLPCPAFSLTTLCVCGVHATCQLWSWH